MNKDNYIVFHLHSDLSNAFTSMDSVNKYKQYVDKAKECGMKAIAFSEHGNIMEWLHKKEYVEKNEMKYIHGVEAYVTENINEKVRDNYHVGLYSKNFEGFLELNDLMSHKKAFNREDGHFHFNPRITFDELLNTSDNIIVTTACIGGILYKGNDIIKERFINFLAENNHRSFLEIQHHNVKEQKDYNIELYQLSNKYNIPLIAGTDTHALNNDYLIGREILQARKRIHFDNEDGWDITFKSYDELISRYEMQNCLSKEVYMQAINNTNVFSDMIDEFKIDRAFKYPKISDNPAKDLKDKITEGYIKKRIKNKPNSIKYNERIKKELYVYEKQGMYDFLLLEENIKRKMREEGRYCGYSRGSVSGSLIAYLLGITDIDSVKYNLYFERFAHMEKISLGDIDSDWAPSDRGRVKEYLYKDIKVQFPKLRTAEIVTFNTIALKGAVKDVSGGIRELHTYGRLESINFPFSEVITLDEANEISSNIELKEAHYRKKYPNMFKYIDILMGVIVSVGTHPSATIVSPHSIVEHMGTFTLKTNEYPICQLNMKEVDSLNYVKLDILGLDNVGIINNACELAGIERLTPDNMDFTDDKVWDNMIKNPTSIFQFESPQSHNVLKQILSDSTTKKIKDVTGEIDKLSLMSMANGAIRPSGASFRDDLMVGKFKDCGHKELDKLFSKTLGQMVYQEQILEFLNKFCGYTLGEADLVRRGFSKKLGTEQFIPDIKAGFINTMTEKYGATKELAEELIESYIQIILDSSSYGFSDNHSQPYSMIGFATVYLRTYHPLEFITAVLEINESKLDKTSSVLEYMKDYTDIKVSPPKFRKSKGSYVSDKENQIIYKGIGSIKGLNADIGNQLYELRNDEYNSFVDLMVNIKNETSINRSKVYTLIQLDFFSEFGQGRKLELIADMFYKWNDKKTAKFFNKSKGLHLDLPFNEDLIKKHSESKTECQYSGVDFVAIIKDCEKMIEDEDYSMKEKIEWQLEYLGYINFTDSSLDKRIVLVTNLDTKYSPKFTAYCLNNGATEVLKVQKTPKRKRRDRVYFEQLPLKDGDIIYATKMEKEPRNKKVGNTGTSEDWIPTGEVDWWLRDYRILEEV